MEWISIKDKMPEITRISEDWRCSDDVLCKSDKFGFFVARWSEFEGSIKNFWNPCGIQGRGQINVAQDVTHWMQIPKIKKD